MQQNSKKLMDEHPMDDDTKKLMTVVIVLSCFVVALFGLASSI